MKIKKIFKALLVFTFIILGLSSCNEKKIENDFKKDKTLQAFVDKSERKHIRGKLNGEPPRLVDYNDQTVSIAYNDYLSIYDIKTGKIKASINLKDLGLNTFSTNNPVNIVGTDKFIALNNPDQKSGYLIDTESLAMGYIDDVASLNSVPIKYQTIEDRYKDSIKKSDDHQSSFADGQAVIGLNKKIIFYYDRENLEDSEIVILDINDEVIGDFTL